MRLILFVFFFSFLSLKGYAQADSIEVDSEVTREEKNAQDKINDRVKQLRDYQKNSPNHSENDGSQDFNPKNKNLDSSMMRSFSYFFDGNNGKMWNGKDSVPLNGMNDMRDKLSKMAPEFEKFFGNAMPLDGMKNFGGMDSMMQHSFGFLFDGNKMMPFGNDSTQMNQLNKLFGNMDLGKMMDGDAFKNFGHFNIDKMPHVAPEQNPKTKKGSAKKEKYATESL